MTELPITTSTSTSAAAGRALLGAAAARKDAQEAGASPFQEALALGLGLDPNGLLLPDAQGSAKGLLKDAAKGDAADDDPTQALPGAAALDAILPGLPLLAPAQAAAETGKTAALAADADAQALGAVSARSKTAIAVPKAASADAAAADFAASGKFSPLAAGKTAGLAANQDAAAATSRARGNAQTLAATATPGAAGALAGDAAAPATPPRIAAAAPEAAASAKSAAQAEGEIQREVAFAAKLLEQQHKTASAPAPTQAHAAPATQLGAATATQAVPAPVATIDARVGERGWDQGLGDKLTWMASNKHQVAELHLNPPDLGPLKVTLTLNHDHASAQFVSAHAQVRDAIETAMPRLREMLADSGITLGDTSVAADSFREQAQPQQQQPAYASASAANAVDGGSIARGEVLLQRARGVVDTFV